MNEPQAGDRGQPRSGPTWVHVGLAVVFGALVVLLAALPGWCRDRTRPLSTAEAVALVGALAGVGVAVFGWVAIVVTQALLRAMRDGDGLTVESHWGGFGGGLGGWRGSPAVLLLGCLLLSGGAAFGLAAIGMDRIASIARPPATTRPVEGGAADAPPVAKPGPGGPAK
ncbi:MAG TPA: hypothetical protein VF796_17825, partial [Humisphaera sp.]